MKVIVVAQYSGPLLGFAKVFDLPLVGVNLEIYVAVGEDHFQIKMTEVLTFTDNMDTVAFCDMSEEPPFVPNDTQSYDLFEKWFAADPSWKRVEDEHHNLKGIYVLEVRNGLMHK